MNERVRETETEAEKKGSEYKIFMDGVFLFNDINL